MNKTKNIFLLITLIAIFFVSICFGMENEQSKLAKYRHAWVGKYPHDIKGLFNLPEIKPFLINSIGEKRYKMITNPTDRFNSYLEEPIDYVSGYFIMNFARSIVDEEDREFEWIYIIIREYTGEITIVITNGYFNYSEYF